MRQTKNRITLLEAQKDKNVITLPKIKPSNLAIITRWRDVNKYVLLAGGLKGNPESNRNIIFAQYYGCGMKKIVLKEERDT